MPVPRILATKYKQPGEVSDFYVDWTDWFAGDPSNGIPARSDSPLTVVFTVPAGLTMLDESLGGYVGKVVVSGGTNGQRYKIVARMSTDATPTIVDEIEFNVYVKEA